MIALVGRLGRIGRHLRRSDRHRWGGPRALAQTVGALLLCVGCAAMVAEANYAELRQQRADSIAPVLAENSADARLLYRFGGFTDIDSRPVTVVLIEPLSEDSPLPPGVNSWPQPGEAVVSPALAEDLTGQRSQLFGPVAGVIGPDGVEVPRERRVYMRPSAQALEPDSMTPIEGFSGSNTDRNFYGAGYLDAAPQDMVQALLVGALVVPGLVGLVVGSGIHGEQRVRQTRILVSLGLGRRHLAVVDVVEAARSVLLGTAVGAALVGVACVADISVPVLDARFPAADTRRVWPLLAAAVLGSLAASFVTVVAARLAQRRLGFVASRLRIRPVSPARALVCVGAAGLTEWLPTQITAPGPRTLTYIAGTLIVAATLPALVSWLVASFGAGLAGWGLRHGTAPEIVGGRHLQRLPARTARLALGICFAILAAGQVQMWSSMMGAQYYRAVSAQERYGAALVEATFAGVPERSMAQLVDELPAGAAPAWLVYTGSADPATPAATSVYATCATLTAIDIGCEDAELTAQTARSAPAEQLVGFSFEGVVRIHDAPSDTAPDVSEEDSLVLTIVSISGGSLDVEEIRALANRVAPGTQVGTPQQAWITGGHSALRNSQWTTALGAVGVAGVVVALCAAAVAEGDATAAAVAPIGAVTGSGALSGRSAVWRIAVPLTIASASGLVAYLVLPIGMGVSTGLAEDQTMVIAPSPVFAVVIAALAAAGTIATSVWSHRAAVRAAHRWRP